MGSFADGLRSLLPSEDESKSSKSINASIPKRSKKERDAFAELSFSDKSSKGKKDRDDSLDSLLYGIQSIDVAQDDFKDIDSVFDSIFEDDQQDKYLMNQLLAQGRAYSRKNGMSAEESDIQKAFAPQEEALHNLIGDLDSDMKGVQGDINSMRMARTRNTKTMADLVQSNASLQNIKLSAIKEINKIHSDIITFNMRAKAAKENTDAENSNEAYAVRKLLEDSSVLASVGGISSVSGARHISDSDNDSNLDPMAVISSDMDRERAYASIDDTDENNFIRYERDGVELYLQYSNSTGEKKVVAKNAQGEIVPDYPVPDMSKVDFTFHPDLGTATDSLSRDYKLENMDRK